MDGYQNTNFWPAEDEGFAHSLIERIAKKFVRSTELPASDLTDLKQILTLALWQRAKFFDRTRSTWRSFATAVVMHAGCKYLRHCRSQKRYDRATVSLSKIVSTKEGQHVELGPLILECQAGTHRGIRPLAWAEHTELSLDVAQITESLPIEWRELVHLSSTHSTAEIASKLGRSRSTVHDLKRRVFERLRSSGLGIYSEN